MTADSCGCADAGDGERDWTVVQWSHAKTGGECALHGCRIDKGEPIAKIWDGQPGRSTRYGQGPGIWVCAECAHAVASD